MNTNVQSKQVGMGMRNGSFLCGGFSLQCFHLFLFFFLLQIYIIEYNMFWNTLLNLVRDL